MIGKKVRLAACCCGSLTAEASGEPVIVLMCSCEQCQRRTGSAFGVSTYWKKENVRLSGEAKCFVRDGQEGRKIGLYFCPNCGSTVYWHSPRRPDGIGIAYGAFVDGELPAPVMSMWEKRKHSWAIPPGDEHHFENPPTVSR